MLDAAGVKAQLKEFDELHSQDGEPVLNENRAWLLFPDGAAREVSQPYGALRGVPRDPEQRAKAIVHYHKILRDRAARAFHRRRIELQRSAQGAQVNPNPAPAPKLEEIRRELEALRDEAQSRQIELDAAQAALEEAIPDSRKRAKQRKAEARREWSEIDGEIRKIEL